MRNKPVFGLLLAAGESSRMGTEKQLLTYMGRSFLQRAIDGFIHAGISDIVVVLGHKFDIMKEHIMKSGYPETAISLARNSAFKDGQLSSIKCGLSLISEKKSIDFFSGFMIQLIDRPLVMPETFKKTLDFFMASEKSIVIPSYEMRRGHPVCFDSGFIEDILSLPADGALRDIVNGNADNIEYLSVEDKGIIINVDTPYEYQKIKGDS